MKNFLKIFSALIMGFVVALLFSSFTNISVFVSLIVIVAFSIIPQPKGVLKGTVLEHWVPYIIERFWKDNAFLKFAYDDSPSVLVGRTVHIPQVGAKPVVIKNRSSYPATVVRRGDTDVNYSLNEYTTDPTHIPNIDKIHLSYSKQDSVLGEHMEVLDETVGDDMLNLWAGTSTAFHTTGGKDAATVGPVTGQTGDRFGFHHSDLKKLMIQFNVGKVPKAERYVLIDDNMYEFFYDTLGDTNAKDFSRYADAENGVIGKLHGFSIMTRSSVIASDNADAIKALGTSLDPTDCLGSIAWQKNTVAFAMGTKTLFQDLNSPLYYGDIHSALMMAGGRVRRADGLGVRKILQGIPA